MKETKSVPAHPAKMLAISHPSFAEAFRFWLKLGFISFGGPAGQIAIMQSELVEKRRWISQSRFLHALNFCMFLPGPEAQQLAIYIGWLLHRNLGRHCRRGVFCHSLDVHSLGIEFRLRRLRKCAVDRRDLLRAKASGNGNRGRRRHSYRAKSAQERNDVDARRARLRRDLFFQGRRSRSSFLAPA